MKKCFLAFLFVLMTQFGYIFLLDAYVLTLVTDKNEEEMKKKLLTKDAWSNLAIILRLKAYHPHIVTPFGLQVGGVIMYAGYS